MVTRALEKYLRISPKKLRPVANLLKRKKVDEATYILMNLNQKGARILQNVLNSALNNAKRLPGKSFTEENLLISRVCIDSGPSLKRYRAMSMGRAGVIRKRTSHILIELDAAKESAKAKKKTSSVTKKKKQTVKAGKK